MSPLSATECRGLLLVYGTGEGFTLSLTERVGHAGGEQCEELCGKGHHIAAVSIE